MTARWQVRALIVVLAVLLMLPVLFIFAQNEQELSRARNKTLARWPAIQVLASEPERYFSTAKRWINDRVGLGITAAGLVRWVKMYAFRDDPTSNLTLNGDYLFMNAWRADPKIRYSLFTAACAPARPNVVAELKRRVDSLEKHFRGYGAEFRLIIIPSMPVIYADKLPQTVPQHLRRDCLDALKGKSAVAAVNGAEQRVAYPLHEFVARRENKAFYPANSFHCVGESSWLAAESYFTKFGIPFPNYTAIRTLSTLSELSRFLGFPLRIEFNSVRHEPARRVRPYRPKNFARLKQLLNRSGAREFTYLEHPASQSDQTALVISNSFGASVKNGLALGYRRLFHINFSEISGNGKSSKELLMALLDGLKPDHVILVTHDGGASSLLRRVASAASGPK